MPTPTPSPPRKLLTILGATGHQGSSLAHTVLTTPALSALYSVRLLVRTPSHPLATHLSTLGAHLSTVDLDDPTTLPSALATTHTLFAYTVTSYAGHTRAVETRQATALIDEAVRQGVRYIIWSTLPSPREISSGEVKGAEHFEVKAEVEAYIRRVARVHGVKCAFVAPAGFMQNLESNMRPRRAAPNAPPGEFVLATPLGAEHRWPMLDVRDVGAWVAPVLADPDRYEGKVVRAAEGFYTMGEIVKAMAEVSGKVVRYEQVGDEVFRAWLDEGSREMIGDMYVFVREWGYYGGRDGEVEIAREEARKWGEAKGLEEFLRDVRFSLE